MNKPMAEICGDLASDAEQAQAFQYLAAYLESLLDQGGRPTRADIEMALMSAAGKIGEMILDRNTDLFVVNSALPGFHRIVDTRNGAVMGTFCTRVMANRRCATMNGMAAR